MKREHEINQAMFKLGLTALALALLCAPPQWWAVALTVFAAILVVANLHALAIPGALKAQAQRDSEKSSIVAFTFAPLIGAAILSGLYLLVPVLVVIAFFAMRRVKEVTEMRELMPMYANSIDFLLLVPVVLFALGVAFYQAEGVDLADRKALAESLKVFAGLSVLGLVTSFLFWVWKVISACSLARGKVSERIAVTLRAMEPPIEPTAKNIREVRLVGDERLDATEREEAERHALNADLVHATRHFSMMNAINNLGIVAVLPMYFLVKGPVVMAMIPALSTSLIAAKTNRPAPVNDFVRGIRVS